MDRAMKNLYARVFSALALASYFIHLGMHVSRYFPEKVPATAWVGVGFFLILAVAGAWAQARLNAKRPALWTTLVICGLLPLGAFAYHRAPLDDVAGYGIVLLLNGIFGATTIAFTAWLLTDRTKS